MNDMEISTIGERIKTLRKKRGYNQKELADLLGKSLRTIQTLYIPVRPLFQA